MFKVTRWGEVRRHTQHYCESDSLLNPISKDLYQPCQDRSNSYFFPVKLQELSAPELLNVCYDSTGQLILMRSEKKINQIGTPQRESEFSTQSIRKLTVQEQAHLKAAFYWLNVYQPEPDAPNLEQVRGYLEAFHHLCEISAWQEASQILFTPTKTESAKKLHEQLRSWGYYSEQIELYSRILGKLNLDLDCLCLWGLGGAYCNFGQVQKALGYHERHLEIARKIGNKLAEIQALTGLVGAYSLLKQHQSAFNCLQQQLAIAREIKARKEEGEALGGLGTYFIFTGKYRRGIKYCQQALMIARELGDSPSGDRFASREMEGLILMWLGGVHISRRRYKQAIAYLKQHLEISDRTDNHCQKYTALYYLGCSYSLLGQAEAAIECLSETLNFARETGSLPIESVALNALGSVYSTCLKQYDDAIEYFKQVLRIGRELENRATEASAISSLSYCYGCLKQHQLAIEYGEQALSIASEINHQEEKGLALACLANTYWHQKQYVRALWLVVQSLVILPPWTSPNGEIIFRKTVEEITQLGKKVIQSIRESLKSRIFVER